MQSSPDPVSQPRFPQPPAGVTTAPPPTPQRRGVNGLAVGLSVGLVGILLIGFVTAFLLYTRTAHGVGMTWNITLGATRTTDGGPIAATALQPGDTYLAIDLTVQNATSSAHDFAGYIDFTVKDGAGQVYKTTYLPGPDPIDGTIPGGAAKNGTIAFEVPSSQHAFTLIYADPSYGNQQWAISV